MTAHALTSDLTYTCSHSGSASVPGTSRLRVDGQLAVTHANMLAATVKLCKNTDANQGQAPCTKCVTSSSGAKVRVDGELVVLDDFTTATNSTPLPAGSISTSSTVHSRLRSI